MFSVSKVEYVSSTGDGEGGGGGGGGQQASCLLVAKQAMEFP